MPSYYQKKQGMPKRIDIEPQDGCFHHQILPTKSLLNGVAMSDLVKIDNETQLQKRLYKLRSHHRD